jgi:diacylglycerol kinase family enzyme
MTEYVTSALFVHTEETKHLIKPLQNNSSGSQITSVSFDALMQAPEAQIEGVDHVVVSGSIDVIKEVLRLSMKYHFSIGIIPTEKQKHLPKMYDIPKDPSAAIDLALRRDGQTMDLILCNGKIMLFLATIGQLPVLDTPATTSWIWLTATILKRLGGFRLHTFEFSTAGKQEINTAATGCMILQHSRGTFASRLISHDHSFSDGMISLVISAPISIIACLKLLWQALKSTKEYKNFPAPLSISKAPGSILSRTPGSM